MLSMIALGSVFSYASNEQNAIKSIEDNYSTELSSCWRIYIIFINNDTPWKLETIYEEYYFGTASEADARGVQIRNNYPPSWSEDIDGLYIPRKDISNLGNCWF